MKLTIEVINTLSKLITKGFLVEELINHKEVVKFEDMVGIALKELTKDITGDIVFDDFGDIRCHVVGNLVMGGLVEDCMETDGSAEDCFQDSIEEVLCDYFKLDENGLDYFKVLKPIVDDLKDGEIEPLTPKCVDGLMKVIRAKIELSEGLITKNEYNKALTEAYE